MPALMNSYTVDAPPVCISRDNVIAANVIRFEQRPTLRYSLIVKGPHQQSSPLNSRAFAILEDIDRLGDNWDNEGTLAPSAEIKRIARLFVEFLDITGQKIYNVAPGPSQEIMIDIRKGDKSIEFLFYPNKPKYVKFCNTEKPEQGLLHPEMLSQLLRWINGI